MASAAEGQVVGGRYVLEALLGRGGTGAVYRAVDRATGKRVAVKLLSAESQGVTLARHRLKFRHEFHTLATLHHPAIVEVFDYGVDGNWPYYTMELLEGRDLSELAPASAQEACRILRDVAAALAFLHARRLVHRDLSPRNVRFLGRGAKLIDFGALVSSGATSGLVVGTLPCIAPEALHCAALDHRTDLFGLGAVAYWLLTRTHAFPAKRIEDLLELWKQRPPPPSSLYSSIPPALDDLVMALLSIEPLGRPSSAVEVIHRLSAIGDLEPLHGPEVSRGYLVSQSLVGRNTEMQDIRRRLASAKLGEGASVVFEGASGAGKSRLLREVALEAKLSGAAHVLWAEATHASQAPYAVIDALLREALAILPKEAQRTAVPHASEILRALPELAARLDLPNPVVSLIDPQEGRARVQAALSEWICALATHHMIVLVVDDLQRADEGSLAVLASVIREAKARRLLFVAGLRSDEPPRAAGPMRTVLALSTSIPLLGLDEAGVRRLLEATFGEVPNLVRLARTVSQTVGGKPLSCLEFVRHLVDRGVLQCVEGAWIIPEDVSAEGVPHTLEDAMNARIQALDPEVRRLGQLLAVHGRTCTLERILRLLPGETAAFLALDTLIREDIVNDEGRLYRFRHDGFLEGFLRSATEAEKVEVHRKIGQLLLEVEGSLPERQGEIGWHLLKGGDELRGAELLAKAGRRLFDAGSFFDAVAPLEAALAVFERARRSPAERLELRFLLLQLGFLGRRELVPRYAEDTLSALDHYSGLSIAARLRRILGRKLSIIFGIGARSIVRAFTPKERRGPGPAQAFEQLLSGTIFMTAVALISFDYAALNRRVRTLEPLDGLWPGIFRDVYTLARTLQASALGRIESLHGFGARALETLRADCSGSIETKLAEGAIRGVLAESLARTGSPETLQQLERLERIGLLVFDLVAKQVRAVYHVSRGELDKAKEVWRVVELMSLRSGSSWQVEAWGPASQADAFAFLGDLIGLRRCIAGLERVIREGLNFQFALERALGEYHRERGEYDRAHAAFARALAELPEGEGIIRPAVLAAIADTHLCAENDLEAKAAAERALEYMRHPERAQRLSRLRAERILAIADAKLGHIPAARQRIDAAIQQAEAVQNPALTGLMHDGAARIELIRGDAQAFSRHLQRAAYYYWPTRNPRLIERWQRLAGLGELKFLKDDGSRSREQVAQLEKAATLVFRLSTASEAAIDAIAAGRSVPERAEHALALLVESAGARGGALFLLGDEGLKQAAATVPVRPDLPERLEAVVEAAVGRESSVPEATEALLAIPLDPNLRLFPLLIGGGGHLAAIGAAALAFEGVEPKPPARAIVTELARALLRGGDVHVRVRVPDDAPDLSAFCNAETHSGPNPVDGVLSVSVEEGASEGAEQ